MADEHLNTEEDVDAILRLAIQQSGSPSADLRTRLMATADELGLTPEQVLAAEEQYRKQKLDQSRVADGEKEDRILWREFRRRQRGDLLSHFGSFVAVNSALLTMDIFAGGGIQWAFWPIAGWGIAVAIHFFSFLAGETTESMAEFEKWKRKRKKRARSSSTES